LAACSIDNSKGFSTTIVSSCPSLLSLSESNSYRSMWVYPFPLAQIN
jgi:hypothetical protein